MLERGLIVRPVILLKSNFLLVVLAIPRNLWIQFHCHDYEPWNTDIISKSSATTLLASIDRVELASSFFLYFVLQPNKSLCRSFPSEIPPLAMKHSGYFCAAQSLSFIHESKSELRESRYLAFTGMKFLRDETHRYFCWRTLSLLEHSRVEIRVLYTLLML